MQNIFHIVISILISMGFLPTASTVAPLPLVESSSPQVVVSVASSTFETPTTDVPLTTKLSTGVGSEIPASNTVPIQIQVQIMPQTPQPQIEPQAQAAPIQTAPVKAAALPLPTCVLTLSTTTYAIYPDKTFGVAEWTSSNATEVKAYVDNIEASPIIWTPLPYNWDSAPHLTHYVTPRFPLKASDNPTGFRTVFTGAGGETTCEQTI